MALKSAAESLFNAEAGVHAGICSLQEALNEFVTDEREDAAMAAMNVTQTRSQLEHLLQQLRAQPAHTETVGLL